MSTTAEAREPLAFEAIASLRQIVFVYQESFGRDGEDWPMEAFTSLDHVLPVPALETSVPLPEIYDGTALARSG